MTETGRYRGLLVDWGGVMTSSVFEAFRAFCEQEGMFAGGRADAAMRRLAAMVTILALVAAGCGSSSLSATQLRGRATQICDDARGRTNRIATPTLPTEGARFLTRGITALAPPLSALNALRPPGDLAGDYRRALAASDRELRALRASLKDLGGGADPVIAIKTLKQRLIPLEARSARAWHALDAPACATL